MTQLSRIALRTAQPTGRLASNRTPTPDTNDQVAPVSDTLPLPAQLSRPPTSDGSLIPYNPVPSVASIYTTPAVLGNVSGINTTPPQIMNREA